MSYTAALKILGTSALFIIISVTAFSALAENKYTVGKSFKDCPSCPEMLVVPAGSFTMGSQASEEDGDKDESPHRKVTIPKKFAVGKYEVTFDEWDACVSEGGCNGYKPNDARYGRSGHPLINVSWDDAKAYIDWLSRKTGQNYRLLTEAEWEYVARAGTTTTYNVGNKITRKQAQFSETSWGRAKKTVKVGSFQPNAFGLYDVHGNVWEWTEDCWHNSYENAPEDSSAWLEANGGNCKTRILRGGSWFDIAQNLRSANRGRSNQSDRRNYIGFRIARTLK